jgi:hypothetical protein
LIQFPTNVLSFTPATFVNDLRIKLAYRKP